MEFPTTTVLDTEDQGRRILRREGARQKHQADPRQSGRLVTGGQEREKKVHAPPSFLVRFIHGFFLILSLSLSLSLTHTHLQCKKFQLHRNTRSFATLSIIAHRTVFPELRLRFHGGINSSIRYSFDEAQSLVRRASHENVYNHAYLTPLRTPIDLHLFLIELCISEAMFPRSNKRLRFQDKLLNKLDEHEPELAGSQDEEVSECDCGYSIRSSVQLRVLRASLDLYFAKHSLPPVRPSVRPSVRVVVLGTGSQSVKLSHPPVMLARQNKCTVLQFSKACYE